MSRVRSRLYIDSDDRLISSGVSDAYFQSNQILRQDVKDVGLSKLHFRYNCPTINPRNNRITFESSASGLIHSVTLTEGFYNPLTLMTMIRDRLNTLTGTSLLTFSIVQLSTVVFELNVAAGSFKFINGSDLSNSHVYRGSPCSGITEMISFSTGITITAKAFYTSYIDIIIPDLKQGQIRESFFSNSVLFNPFEHLHRFHVNNIKDQFDNIIIDEEIHNIHYSEIYKRRLTELNIKLYDEFGELIYDKKNVDGSYSNYISYGLEISLLS